MKKWGLGAFGLAAAAGIIALSVGVLSGIAQAQVPPDEDHATMRSEYQQRLAQKLGVTVEALEAAQKAVRDELIDEAVAAGRITAEQAERLKAGQAGVLKRGRALGIHTAAGNVFKAAAEILGLSTEELRAGLAAGKSLNDLAAEQGVGNLEAQLVAKITAEVQAKVADGTITQAQADRLLENLGDRVSRAVELKGGQGRPGGRFGPGGPNRPANQN